MSAFIFAKNIRRLWLTCSQTEIKKLSTKKRVKTETVNMIIDINKRERAKLREFLSRARGMSNNMA